MGHCGGDKDKILKDSFCILKSAVKYTSAGEEITSFALFSIFLSLLTETSVFRWTLAPFLSQSFFLILMLYLLF